MVPLSPRVRQSGKTALHMAVQRNQPTAVAALLDGVAESEGPGPAAAVALMDARDAVSLSSQHGLRVAAMWALACSMPSCN